MAKREHLKILKQGVAVWNEWRKENPKVIPDLGGIDLFKTKRSGENLREINFSGAYLDEATLSWADLSMANLREASICEANLSAANLNMTDLCKARLILTDCNGAQFREAKLRGANLRWTNFNGADLNGADFSRVLLNEAIFSNTSLKNVKGLTSCRHTGPSSIDYHTLQQSGKLPLAFLRGCGLPDSFIDYLPSLLNQPSQYYSCFISYSSKNQEFADRLHADLQNNGVRCWLASEDLKIGDKIRSAIDDAIKLREKLLIVLSEQSISSTWVEKEVETAFEEENKRGTLILFPIRIDNAVMKTDQAWAADIRRQRHIGDFSNWKDHDAYKKGFDRLLRDLKQPSKIDKS